GGTAPNDGRNVYRLIVSDPSGTYYLNSGTERSYCALIDEMHTVPMQGGATVRLSGDPQDFQGGRGIEERNEDSRGKPLASPAGIPPTDAPFDGQFMQIDAEDVVIER